MPIEKLLTVNSLEYDILVTNLLGHSIRVNKVYRNCPVSVQVHAFPANLIKLLFHEFDVILGRDWLSKHRATVDCHLKQAVLKTSKQREIIVQGEKNRNLSDIISTTRAKRLIRKGYEAYLACAILSKQDNLYLHKISTMCDFLYVFLKELTGLPPKREVEFGIEVLHDTSPISTMPYRMAPAKLIELKVQL